MGDVRLTATAQKNLGLCLGDPLGYCVRLSDWTHAATINHVEVKAAERETVLAAFRAGFHGVARVADWPLILSSSYSPVHTLQ